ncbi:RPA2A [Scenedesmus sp. PABB004]|nr:RPA2A [Scenedesmus sp. PABB004]
MAGMFGGGFGGDAGNQFAGGGFMPSQANDQGFGGGAGSGGRSRGSSAVTLRTLTIRQLVKAVANTDDDVFKVDGVELNNVTVLGKIVGVKDSNMNLTLTISDGTGTMELDHWISDDSDVTAANKKAEWRAGVYVRAFGHLRRSQHSHAPNLQAFNVRSITNFNEVTYHFLRCIFEHLHITKGGAGAPGQARRAPRGCRRPPGLAGGAGMAGLGAPGGGAAAGGWGGAGGATAYAGAAGGAGDPCSAAVMAIIQAANSDNGAHKHELYTKLSGQYGKAAIDAAIESLTSEAHVYTTCDDDHFKAA